MKSTKIFIVSLILIILGLVYLKWQASREIQTFVSSSPSPTTDPRLNPEPIPSSFVLPRSTPTNSPTQSTQ